MRTLILFLLSVCFCGVLPASAWAWGKTGHRVGGAIAEAYLSPEARAGVAALVGVETLAEGSVWADFMRSSNESFWRREAGPWHYVTVPDGESYDTAVAPDEGDSVTALARFRAEIVNPDLPLAERQRALRFAVHIIGDLHQPLHAGNGDDRGGNDVQIKWFGDMTRLHTIWDTKIVDHQQLSYTEMAEGLSRRITPEQASAWDDPDPRVWIAESVALRPGVYPGEARKDLRWNYVFDHQATVDLRLSQSGVRIASWLNDVFAAAPAAP